jgi:hypothetical protein
MMIEVYDSDGSACEELVYEDVDDPWSIFSDDYVQDLFFEDFSCYDLTPCLARSGYLTLEDLMALHGKSKKKLLNCISFLSKKKDFILIRDGIRYYNNDILTSYFYRKDCINSHG